ncbi:MAG TPA: DUF4157 domain-containing protein, partial [Longimicrobiales bacterium]|nr:DUF4157 domain-containing protein [Longimicrobiales bacterium]
MNRVLSQPLPGPAAARAPSAASVTSARQNPGRLFRKCSCGGDHAGECDECKKAKLRRSSSAATSSTTSVPGVVNEVLRKSGAPIDPAERVWLESRFGHDFSRVRVHDDARAAESADAVNARAYTVGSHVVFGAGEYQRGSTESRKLLAHELAHVVQQSGAPRESGKAAPQPGLQMAAATAIGGEHDPEELEAEAVAERVTQGLAHGNAPPALAQKPGMLQRVARANAPTLNLAVAPAAPVTAPARASFATGFGLRALVLPADAGSDPDPSSRFLHASSSGILRRQTCGNQAPLTQTPHGPCAANARGLEPCCTQSMLNEIRALRERACPLVAQALASLDQPDQVADKLRAYFAIEPSDTASVAAVRAGLSAMLDFLQRGDVQFFCWDACDSMCNGIRAEASPEAGLSQHLIALCGDYEGAVQQGRPYLA